MDRFPPAEHGPRYEIQSIGRSLNDLNVAAADGLGPDVRTALLWWAAGFLVMVAFVGLLVVGAPIIP